MRRQYLKDAVMQRRDADGNRIPNEKSKNGMRILKNLQGCMQELQKTKTDKHLQT